MNSVTIFGNRYSHSERPQLLSQSCITQCTVTYDARMDEFSAKFVSSRIVRVVYTAVYLLTPRGEVSRGFLPILQNSPQTFYPLLLVCATALLKHAVAVISAGEKSLSFDRNVRNVVPRSAYDRFITTSCRKYEL